MAKVKAKKAAAAKGKAKSAAKKPSAPKTKVTAKPVVAKAAALPAASVMPGPLPQVRASLAPRVGPVAEGDGTGGSVARATLRGLPPIDAVTRTVFARQVTVAELERLGGATVAKRVLAEAEAFIVVLGNARVAHPTLARRYGDARFAYFCERVVALADQLAREHAPVRGDASRLATWASAGALKTARLERDALLSSLEPIVRGDPVSTGVLAGVRADVADATLGASLQKLADVAERWLARAATDLDARTLVVTFGLGDDDVIAARSAAAALGPVAASPAKPVTPGADSAELDVLEGIVLVEMKVALAAIHGARVRDPSVPALAPGPGTRAALS